MKVTVERKTAYHVIRRRLMTPEAFSDDLLSEALETSGEGSVNRAFTEALVKGVVERELTLDALIRKLSDIPLRKIRKPVLAALYCGIYEVLFMQSEAYAAVNAYVEIVRRSDFRNLSGFVNAVLRAAAARGDALLQELTLTERLSVPDGLFDMLRAAYPDGTAEKIFEDALCPDRRPTVIRRMVSVCDEDEFTDRMLNDGLQVRKTGLSDDTYYVSGKNLTGTASFENGLFYVQDLSSAMAVDTVSDLFSEPLRVLDLCAAPGGKTCHAADLMNGRGEIVSNDRTQAKQALIDDNIARFGFGNVISSVWDATLYNPAWEKAFGLVIADVPCSGLGVIAHKGEIKYRVTRETVASLASIQKTILENAAHYVCPGGTLLYSTCTLTPEENDGQIDGFLASHPEFGPVDFSGNLAEIYRVPSVRQGRLQLLNGVHPQDGFFMARLKKEKDLK